MIDDFTLHLGDSLEVMRGMEADSIDSIVTDPPYGLSFMGKNWDHGIPGIPYWEEALRVAKPGAWMLAFGGTRTWHRLAVAIEDAGWEIRDTIMYVYGSGFPKSHDVSKAIDKAAGAERETTGIKDGTYQDVRGGQWASNPDRERLSIPITAPATDAAKEWEGWGTALKPSWEPVIVARKPLIGTVAENVLAYGTGAINIDGARVGTEETVGASGRWGFKSDKGWNQNSIESKTQDTYQHTKGRWPANLIHDGSDEVMELFPQSKSTGGSGEASQNPKYDRRTVGNYLTGKRSNMGGLGDTGSAARFFYCAKASKRDRDEGCEGLEEKQIGHYAQDEWSRQHMGNTPDAERKPIHNHHPTVKPTSLMRHLCKLVTRPGGVILDPFCGSGSTGKAAILEGFQFVGIDNEPEYIEISRCRIEYARKIVEKQIRMEI